MPFLKKGWHFCFKLFRYFWKNAYMKTMYFLRWPLLIFLTGFLIQSIGGIGKIRHWPGADGLITIGSLVVAVGIIVCIFKILFMKKPE
jgi:hypothetical protein